MVGLLFIPLEPSLFYLAPVVWGICASMFWSALHVDVSYVKNNKKATAQVGNIMILTRISSTLTPFIGGFLATQYGISYSIFLAIILLLMSSYPLFKTKEKLPPANFSVKKMWQLKIKYDLISNFANNMDTVIVGYFWALFIYLFLGTYVKIGAVISLSLLASVVLSYYLGRSGDSGKNSKNIKYGTVANSVVYFVRGLASQFSYILGVNIVSDLAGLYFKIPYTTMYYQKADRYSRLEYITKMEVIGNLGALVPWLILIAVIAYGAPIKMSIIAIFLLGALVSLGINLITKEALN